MIEASSQTDMILKSKPKGIRITKEILDQKARLREEIMGKKWEGIHDTAVLHIIKSPRKYQQLFQENPDEICTFTMKGSKSLKHLANPFIKNRSHTNSRESQQNGAMKEKEILKKNGRIPTKQITIRFLYQFKTKNEMADLLSKMFRYLADHGIIAAVVLEGTKDGYGKPCNRVHCHILIDDKEAPRSKKKTVAMFAKACRLRGLERGKDIKIGFQNLPKNFTFDYFVKIGAHGKSIPLFKKGLYIRKFRYIGKWFTKSKRQLWSEYVEEIRRIKAVEATIAAILEGNE